MRTASVLSALSFAATTFAQAVEVGIEPSEPAPEGCDRSPKGNFTIGYIPVAQASRKRSTAPEDANGALYMNLEKGVLTDGWDRTGSVVANHQFQFDGPPQAGAIYTGGFSVCENRSLAIGGTTRWWICRSGDFFNLYDAWIGAQCEEIRILTSFVDEPTSSSSSAAASSTAESTSSGGNSTTASITGTSTESSESTATPSLSAIPLTSINGTEPSGDVTRVSASASATPTSTSNSEDTPDAPPNSAAALPTRASRDATFGAVIGIVAAAWIL